MKLKKLVVLLVTVFFVALPLLGNAQPIDPKKPLKKECTDAKAKKQQAEKNHAALENQKIQLEKQLTGVLHQLAAAHTALVKANQEVQRQCSIQVVNPPGPGPIHIPLPPGYARPPLPPGSALPPLPKGSAQPFPKGSAPSPLPPSPPGR